jgi:hypothetical protein
MLYILFLSMKLMISYGKQDRFSTFAIVVDHLIFSPKILFIYSN